ncbi:MAG: MoxR family ATPase [Chloroflexota bacterium]
MSQSSTTSPDAFAGERFWRAICDSIRRAVVVDDEVIRLLAIALLAGGHALIEDVPGVGKTLLARAFSRALGINFSRVQGTPDLLPSDILGASVLEGGTFRFIAGPIFTNVLLVDEINRATPRSQSALLEAMEEGHVSIEGQTRDLPDPFLVLATENPIELEGTFALPEAQLDRFLVRVRLGYPSRIDEGRIARRYRDSAEPLDAVTVVAPPEQLLVMRDSVRMVGVSSPVEDYIVDLVRATRERPELRLGSSPRSSMSLYRATQARAYLAGRDFALPDDVKALVPAVLGHRLLLDIDREIRGSTVDGVIQAVLGTVAAPPAPSVAAQNPP